MERRKEEDRPRQDDIATGDENWGKEDGTIRLAFQNVNGLGFDEGQIKLQRIFDFLHKYNIDKLGIAEVNIYWQKMDKDKRLWDKTRGWFEGLHVHTSYNTNEPTISKRYQPGGVASFTKNKLAYKIMGKGIDMSNLGRWSWTTFQGKEGRVLRVITAYRPCNIGG